MNAVSSYFCFKLKDGHNIFLSEKKEQISIPFSVISL